MRKQERIFNKSLSSNDETMPQTSKRSSIAAEKLQFNRLAIEKIEEVSEPVSSRTGSKDKPNPT